MQGDIGEARISRRALRFGALLDDESWTA